MIRKMNKALYTVALADDQLQTMNVLKASLSDYPFVLIVYEGADALLTQEYLRTHKVDMLFLDMDMPIMDGKTLIKSLKNPPVVTICSGSGSFGYVTSEIGAMGYISKMPESALLEETLWRMIREVDRREREDHHVDELTVKDREGQTVLIPFADIRYIASADKIQTIVTTGGSVEVYISLAALLQKLPPEDFKQVHRSYAVALVAVQSYAAGQIKLKGEKITIPLGRYCKKAFDRAMTIFKLKHAGQ